VLRRDPDVLDGIAFGRADLASTLHEGDRVDIVARLVSRVFGGLETLQLEVRDVAPSGSHPRAAEVLTVAREGGMTTLLQDGISKALAGVTDVKQVKAVANA